MKIPKHIHLLRVWNPQTLKIRSRIFIKTNLVVGSDRSCDLQTEGLGGLLARLDLEAAELTLLKTGRVERIEPRQIFEIEGLAIQWRAIPILHKRWILPLAAFGLGLILLCLSHFLAPESGVQMPCSNIGMRLSQGRWDSHGVNNADHKQILDQLNQYRLSFENSLKLKNLLVAQAELQSMNAVFAKVHEESGCRVRAEVERLGSRLSEIKIQDHLKSEHYRQAAEEFSHLRSRIQGRKMDRLIKRLRRAATNLYIQGYELEDSDPTKSEELIEEAEIICTDIQMAPDCYRSHGTIDQNSQMPDIEEARK